MDKKEQAAKRFKERQMASKRFKLPEGDTTLRVLPNVKNQKLAPYIEFGMHQNVGARKAYLRCGKKMNGEGECWICDTLIPKLEKKGKKAHLKKAEELARKDSFAVQIIYKVGTEWMGPTMWEVSPGVSMKLIGIMSRKEIDHPTKGYNLTITRVGSGLSTKYPTLERDDEKSEVDEKYLSKIKPFSALLKSYDEEVQKTEYYGHEQTDEPEEDEEEEETTKKKGKSKKEDEEDEEDDSDSEDEEDSDGDSDSEDSDEESEEDDEDEKPKGKKGKKSKDEDEEEEEEEEGSEEEESEDEEEESEDEEDEDEEDEKPKGKKKKGKKESDDGDDDESEEDDDVPDLDEEEEEEDEKPKKDKKGKKSKDEEEEEEEESEDEEEEEEEEEEEPKKKKLKKKKGKK